VPSSYYFKLLDGGIMKRKIIDSVLSLASARPDLAAEWDIELNGSLSPHFVTSTSTQKVWWRCEKGHAWSAQIYKRVKRNDGCPYCFGRLAYPGETDLATTNPNLAAEWHPTKNGDQTPTSVRAGSSYNAWWLGSCGHEWQTPVYVRNKGAGCPYCSNRKLLKGFNDLSTCAPEAAAEWHPTKNGTLTPDNVLAYSTQEAVWLGKCGHEWSAKVVNRTRGVSCPYCTNDRVLKGFNDLCTTHPAIAAQWHPTKNDLTPDNVTQGCHKQIIWVCEKGHEWSTTVNARITQNSGCPYCANKKLLIGYNDFATRFPDIAKEWHPTKNAPLQPSDILIGKDKVWWLCSVCGHEWSALPNSRAHGIGCPACANKRKGRRLCKTSKD